MKKTVVSLLAALMVFAITTPVLASPSKTAEDAAKPVTGVVTEDGVELEVSQVVESVVADVYAQVEETQDEESEVVAIVEVSLPEGTEIPEAGIAVTFAVEGIVEGDNVYLLHGLDDGTWEVIEADEVKDGEVTATFTSFSPVAVIKVAPAEEESPKTGAPLAVMPLVALACAAGAARCARKVK